MTAFLLPLETAGLSQSALHRARKLHENMLPGTAIGPVVTAVEMTLQDLDNIDSFDWALRLLVDRLLGFPSDWGDVEGVTAHMSGRGYCELHVWTTKTRGHPLEITIGNRFTGIGKVPSYAATEERQRTHGRQSFSVRVPTKDGAAAAQFILDALAVTEPGPLEQLASSHQQERT